MNIFTRDPKRDELSHIPLFASLPKQQLELLTRSADLIEVPAGTELIREGENGHEFFALVEGEVEVSKDGETIATEQSGDVFGEIALLHDVPRTATVTTTAPSRLYVLNRQAFRSIVADRFAA